MTIAQLKACLPYASKANLAKFGAHLLQTMDKYQINTPARQAAFLAQLAHESGSLRYTLEVGSGAAYDTRTDLGNTKEVDGDGEKNKGVGLIQLTGATNIGLYADYVKNPAIKENPRIIANEPFYTCDSAGWFWTVFKKLNALADKDTVEAYLEISVKINGRNKLTKLPNHWNERQLRWAEAKRGLGIKVGYV